MAGRIAPIAHLLTDDGRFPNSRLPALVYPGVLSSPGRDLARAFEQLFDGNTWTPAWRNGVYTVHHYHSTAHEVLGVYAGEVRVQLGGPRGIELLARAGDVLVIPAGVAHKNVGASPDFATVGAYPAGTGPDMNFGKPGERPDTDQRIAALSLPSADPVTGRDGGLVKLWR